jgi:HEAT repeat protein
MPPEDGDSGDDDGAKTPPAPPPPGERPGIPGSTGGARPGPLGGGFRGGPGTGRRGAGYKGLDRWEYWWEYNKDRYLHRMPLGVVSGTPRRGAKDDLWPRLREEVLIPALRQAAGDRRDTIRAGAMLALGKVGDFGSFATLYRGFRDGSDDVRKASLLGMAYLGTEEVWPVLERTLRNDREETEIRAFAAAALGLVGAPDAAHSLGRMVLDRTQPVDVRAASAMALGFLTEEEGTVALLTVLGTPRDDARVRAIAAIALGRQGDIGQTHVLLTLLRDRDTEVVRGAVLGLGAIEFRSRAEQLLDRAVQARRDWLAGDALTPEALRALDDAIARLEENAKAEAPRFRAIRRTVAKRLADVVEKSSDQQTMGFALMSLAEVGAQESVTAIREILERKSHRLKGWAGVAAGVSGDVSLAPYLRRAFDRKGEDPSVRAAMAVGLGLLRDRESAETLANAALDEGEDPDVRGYSITGLGMMWHPRIRDVMAKVLATKGNPALHRNAALAGGLAGGSDTGDQLVVLMEESNDLYVKAAVSIALGYLRDRTTARRLAEKVADRREPYLDRLFAVLAVGYLGDRRAAPPLLSRLAWHHDYRVGLPALITLTSLL